MLRNSCIQKHIQYTFRLISHSFSGTFLWIMLLVIGACETIILSITFRLTIRISNTVSLAGQGRSSLYVNMHLRVSYTHRKSSKNILCFTDNSYILYLKLFVEIEDKLRDWLSVCESRLKSLDM